MPPVLDDFGCAAKSHVANMGKQGRIPAVAPFRNEDASS